MYVCDELIERCSFVVRVLAQPQSTHSTLSVVPVGRVNIFQSLKNISTGRIQTKHEVAKRNRTPSQSQLPSPSTYIFREHKHRFHQFLLLNEQDATIADDDE
jgi:hypothetical protein